MSSKEGGPPEKPPKPSKFSEDSYVKKLKSIETKERKAKKEKKKGKKKFGGMNIIQSGLLATTDFLTSSYSKVREGIKSMDEDEDEDEDEEAKRRAWAKKHVSSGEMLRTDFTTSASRNAPPEKPAKPGYLRPGNYAFYDAVTKKENPLRYTAFAHNIGLFSGILGVYLGIVSALWVYRLNSAILPPDSENLLVAQQFTGIYTAVVNALLLAFEIKYGLNKTLPFDKRFIQYRAFFYFVLSLPVFSGYATILVGMAMVLAAIMNFVATRNHEVGKMPGGKYLMHYFGWEEDRGTYKLAIYYISLNACVFYYNFMKIEFFRQRCQLLFGRGSSNAEFNCPSFYAAVAKGFGNMLNLNAALLLVPIMRSVLTKLAEKINKNNSFPIRKAIEFHQIIGSVVFLSVFGHVFFHYVNFTITPVLTIQTFGNIAWYTGILLSFVMIVMYSGAHYTVKRQNYELFWNSHHLYTTFFMLLLAHGPHFWQWFAIPAMMFAWEKVARHRSRLKRKVYVRSVEFIPPVLNLNFSPERVDDFVFKEGQYLYILCPQASSFQWHPFSMSSAFGDLEKYNYVSIHIRVQDDTNSWTYRLKEYFRLIAGKVGTSPDSPFFSDHFFHFDQAGKKQRGLYNGPDGKPLIRVDGPFNSPTQVYYAYRHVILVGSGIGLTPSSAIMRSILRYKWSKGFFPETIRFCWVLRHSEAESFYWFIELLVDLMAKVKSDRANGAISKSNFLQINIYVTGYKNTSTHGNNKNLRKPKRLQSMGRASFKKEKVLKSSPVTTKKKKKWFPKKQRVSVARARLHSVSKPFDPIPEEPQANQADRRRIEDDTDVQEAGLGREILGFDANDLFAAIRKPTVAASDQIKIDPDALTSSDAAANFSNSLEDIWIWSGRPVWSTVFSQMKETALKRNLDLDELVDDVAKKDDQSGDVGVCFCGSSAIGRDLQENVKRFSDKEVEFRLNQEYF